MSNCHYLYNVNQITVKPCYIDEYLDFITELDAYLLRNYSGYYAGLQLYRNNKNHCEFSIIARYNDLFGLEKAVKAIQCYIKQQYETLFGENVARENVFSFSNSKRIYC